MKELLAVISLLVSGAVAEAPASYPPSGWRPSGPAFDLPQRGQQPPLKQQYLPPVDPRNSPPREYGTPEDDVSVLGLPPQQDDRLLFKNSPISGQQYSGPSFNTDLRSLDEKFRQSQYEQQQERYRDYIRQKQLEAAQTAPNGNRLPTPQVPRQFSRPPPTAPSTTTEASTTPVASTTELDLNQEEVFNKDKESAKLKNGKVAVEISKQNLQEYPGELFLSSLAQLQLQPQFIRLQPISGAYLQPQSASQKQLAGFDAAAHFSALPSVLAQQQAQNLPQSFQNPALLLPNDQTVAIQQQPIVQYQPNYQPQSQGQTQLQPEPVILQAPAQFQPNFYAQPNPNSVAVQQPQYQPVNSYQPGVQPNPDAVTIQPQYQPANAFNQAGAQPSGFPQFQAQRVQYQPQGNFAQPSQFGHQIPQLNAEKAEIDNEEEGNEQAGRNNQQQLYQQPIVIPQPQLQYQPQQFPARFVQNQDQAQFYQPQTQYLQPQGQLIQIQSQLGQQSQQGKQNSETDNQEGRNGQVERNNQQQLYQQPIVIPQPQQQYQPQQFPAQLIQNQDQAELYQPQTHYLQPQGQLIQPLAQLDQNQFLQPQSQYIQPQSQYVQPQDQFFQLQGQFNQNQGQFIQPQFQFAQQQAQGQDALQSGLDINQQGNDIDQNEDKERDEPEGPTAVANAFGTRTQPRIQPQYGVPVPRVQASPRISTTTESNVEEVTEEGPAVAQAVAVANGERRQSARLRNRRIRPVYAVDRSGRLVLAEA